jgi:probable F420-dependent oxidoreductase
MANPELHFGASMVLGASEVAAEARWLEDLGYEYISAGEHFMRGNPPGVTHAAIPLLAVAAGATERIRVLSSIVLTPFYHPLMLAKLSTTLDIASGGRFTLGVGVGGEFPVEFQAAGLNVRQRGRRTDECLDVVRRLWTQERVSYQGRHFQMEDVSINPRPAQQPHPPVWVAGRRDAAMRRAARYGDGWLPYFYSPERYRSSVDQITQMAREEDRDLSGFQWAFFPYIAIYPTAEEAARVAAQALGGRYLYGGDFVNIVENYCLLGPPERCIERLQEFIDAGARHIIFSVACPREERPRHIETIAGEIIPHFRDRQPPG